jgi:hypothetical protein
MKIVNAVLLVVSEHTNMLEDMVEGAWIKMSQPNYIKLLMVISFITFMK